MPFITQGKTNWKFLLIVIILAIIVGGGALWYAKRPEKPYQPVEIQKTETANWNTYRNEKYGFEMKYPSNLQSGPITDYGGVYNVPFIDTDHMISLSLDIDSSRNYSETIQEFVNNLNKTWEATNSSDLKITIINTQTTSVGGNTAVEQQTAIGTVPGISITIYFKVGTSIWTFDLSPGYANKTGITIDEINTYHQILSTFKLL